MTPQISTFKRSFATILLAAFLLLLSRPTPVFAAAPIVLDGNFGDWAGQTCIPDPPNDATDSKADILNFCFANNPNDPTSFFMIERQQANNPLDLQLYVDTNNNGVYGEGADRLITVFYNPQGAGSSVDVNVYSGTGQFLSTVVTGANWGEGGHLGGSRVEWRITFAALGIAVGQPIRMYVASMKSGSVSDNTVEVQWSPANALGVIILGGILVSGSVWYGYRRSRAGK